MIELANDQQLCDELLEAGIVVLDESLTFSGTVGPWVIYRAPNGVDWVLTGNQLIPKSIVSEFYEGPIDEGLMVNGHEWDPAQDCPPIDHIVFTSRAALIRFATLIRTHGFDSNPN